MCRWSGKPTCPQTGRRPGRACGSWCPKKSGTSTTPYLPPWSPSTGGWGGRSPPTLNPIWHHMRSFLQYQTLLFLDTTRTPFQHHEGFNYNILYQHQSSITKNSSIGHHMYIIPALPAENSMARSRRSARLNVIANEWHGSQNSRSAPQMPVCMIETAPNRQAL